jgi:DNA-binding NarL/FixJ family response regulator
MPGHLPSVDHAALTRLRALVQEMHEGNGRAVPMRQLVSLAHDVQLEAGVTIDFEASRQLGQPMVVLRVPARNQPADSLKVLSRREHEIVALIAEGLSNKQIARSLFIALATVKDHVHRILTKTGLPNRAALAAAYQGYDHATP